MKREMILPVLLSFGISLALGPVLIPFLRKVKAGQKEREEGVPSHQKKAGTPTMGGVMFLAAFTAVSLLFRKEGAEVVPVLFLTLGFGLIGFLDDYLKVVLHRSDGLYPKQKMALQAVITAVFLWYLARFSGISLRMRIPFLPGKELDAGIFTIPFLAFVILGTVNGVNFTGLYGGTSAMGWQSITLPENMTWSDYFKFLLCTLPEEARENYLHKLSVSMEFWRNKGGCLAEETIAKLRRMGIPITVSETTNYKTDKKPVRMDYQDDVRIPEFKELPTFKRICICILKNDHACKYMGFAPSKAERERRAKVMQKYKSIMESYGRI